MLEWYHIYFTVELNSLKLKKYGKSIIVKCLKKYPFVELRRRKSRKSCEKGEYRGGPSDNMTLAQKAYELVRE